MPKTKEEMFEYYMQRRVVFGIKPQEEIKTDAMAEGKMSTPVSETRGAVAGLAHLDIRGHVDNREDKN